MLIHCAAICKIYKIIDDPDKGFDNVEQIHHVLEFCRKNKIPKIVYFSSSRILSEEKNPYTAGKIFGEESCKAYKECYDIDYIIIRPSTVYGDFWDETKRLMHIFITSALKDKDLEIYGNPETKTLDFTYVSDFIEGVMLAINGGWNKEYNISGNSEIKIYDLAKFIIEETNSKSKIVIFDADIAQPQEVKVNISEIEKLGYKPVISIEEGVRRNIGFCKGWMEDSEMLDNIKFVVDNSSFVSIDYGKIKDIVGDAINLDFEYWFNSEFSNINRLSDKDKLNFLFIFDSINFCYWGSPKWTVKHNGKNLGGAYSMIKALDNALLNGKMPVLDMNYLSTISEEDFSEILKGEVKIPLFEERLKIIRENASILRDKFEGNFSKVVEMADKDGLKLLSLINENFHSFQDSYNFKGNRVNFHKRAQLLVFETYELFKGKGYGDLRDIGKLIGFADYKIPHVLHMLGVLNYNEELTNKIDNKIELEKGCQEEIEIRANMLWCIELLRRELAKNNMSVYSVYINDYLWGLGRQDSMKEKSYHLVRTTDY